MKISAIRVEQQSDHQRVEADIGPYCLWFRLPATRHINPLDATPFVVAAIVPSMLLGEPLEVDSSLAVSPRLLGSMPNIQAIYHYWNPVFKPVDIVHDAKRWAEVRDNGESPKSNASFFSGGVDGSYTLIKHQDSIDDLILINGFDFSMDSPTWEHMVARSQIFATAMHKTLVPVETNFKTFTAAFGIARYANSGTVLAAIGLMLGYRQVYCSASDTYRLFRSIGSHPLLDPLWSSEKTEFIHTGLEADRAGKLAVICDNDVAIENLWVCWKDPRSNCGRCAKCVRTALALRVLGLAPAIFTNPPDTRSLGKLPIRSLEDLEYYELFLERAQAMGSPQERVLRKKILAFKVREILKDLRDFALPHGVQSWLSRRDEADREVDISVHARYSDAHVLAAVRKRLAEGRALENQPPLGTVFTLPSEAAV